jgi:hypothetical protein
MEIILWLLIGMFIGWNLPQPAWATNLQTKVKEIILNLKDKNHDGK